MFGIILMYKQDQILVHMNARMSTHTLTRTHIQINIKIHMYYAHRYTCTLKYIIIHT